MALIFSDGMDQYTAVADCDLRYSRGTGTGFNATAGRWSGGAIYCTDDDQGFTVAIPSMDLTSNPIHTSFWYYCDNLPSINDYILRIGSSVGADYWGMKLTTSGALSAEIFNATTVVILTAAVITAGTWHHIEVDLMCDNSPNGRLTIWVDGIEVGDFTGDTYSSGNKTTTDQVRYFGHTNTGNQYFDDILIWDEAGTDFATTGQLGEHRIETIVPDGDSAVQFTPSAGANYAAVDEAGMHDGDTTYVESTTVGHVDLYTLAAQAATPSATLAIAVHTRAKKTDTGAVTMRQRIKHGTTTVEGGDHSITAGYAHYADYWGQNPDTGPATWGTTDVNSLLSGIEYQA
jgi:hypothetical protein